MAGAVGQPGFSQMTAETREKVVLALHLWDDLIVNSINEAGPGPNYLSTDIEYAMSTTFDGYAGTYRYAGSVWLNANYVTGSDTLVTPPVGGYGFMAILHESGHALSLNHMGAYNFNGFTPSSMQDSNVYSVMSYFGPGSGRGNPVAWADWVAGDGVLYNPQTPMMSDVLAMQAIYGADRTTRAGDTVYGFNSNISDGTEAVFNFALNRHPVLCIYDAGGNDTLDLSGFTAPSRINLAAGGFSDCDDMTNNVSIAQGCIIENGRGGRGDDTLLGNGMANALEGNDGADNLNGRNGDDTLCGGAGSDSLTGGAGDDILKGGADEDVACFASGWQALQVSYDAVTGSYTVVSASEGTDILTGIERICDANGVSMDLSLFRPPVISIGADAVAVKEGDAGTSAWKFTVSLAGPSAYQQTIGWSVVLVDAPGQAQSADFFGATSGTVVIAAGATSATASIQIAGDTLIESDEAFHVTLVDASTGKELAGADGTISNDDFRPLTLTGTTFSNVLTGGEGGDTLSGLGGNDTISGQGGADLIIGGTGYDKMTGGAGADRFDFDTTAQTSLVTLTTGKLGSVDVIQDFTTGSDIIDLGTIDASTKLTGNNAFTWLGTAAITTSSAGELRYQQYDNAGTSNDYTLIYGDTDADVLIEFAIKLTGLVTLSASDFVL